MKKLQPSNFAADLGKARLAKLIDELQPTRVKAASEVRFNRPAHNLPEQWN